MYIFLVFCAVLIPCILLVGGWLMRYRPPKQRQNIYGYRTKRSMASQEAWDFAHQLCGALWLKWGLILLFVSLPLALWGIVLQNLPFWGLSLCLAQSVILGFTIYQVELALKHQFPQK